MVECIENKGSTLGHVFLDTPGQIEVFTWSASGTVITEALSSSFPTVLLYVVDTPRTVSPSTFMSNMLYACSIMYKTKLPFILVFNKIDVSSHDFALRWMADFEAFDRSLEREENFMSDLTRSMSLLLNEFYSNLKTVGVSAVTGTGFDELFKRIAEAKEEYYEVFAPELQQRISRREQQEKERQLENMDKLRSDLEKTGGGKVVISASKSSS